MKALLTYEFNKIFKQNKWSSLTLLGVSTFFLIGSFMSVRTMDWSASPLQILSMFSFVGLATVFFILLISPTITAMQNYYRDLNSQHAVFETYIPENGWKRLAAKYISYFSHIQVGVLLAAMLLGLTMLVVRGVVAEQITLEMGYRMQEVLDYLNTHRVETIWRVTRALISVAYCLLSLTFFFNFFITLHSVLRHRIKAATPLTFLAGAVTSISLGWIGDLLFNTSGRMHANMVTSWPEMIFDFVIAAIAFYAMGWMLEHKTELK
jgi:hypothetical protein